MSNACFDMFDQGQANGVHITVTPVHAWLALLDGREVDGLLAAPAPQQYEFARLNLTYVITSKRKLAQLVQENKVSGWDDPRMPTIVGLRRRGYTPASIQLFAERIGVTRSDSWIDYSTLEGCLREDLEAQAARAMAVLDPVRLVITNWPEGDEVMLEAVNNPEDPTAGTRLVPFTMASKVRSASPVLPGSATSVAA